MDSHDLQLNYLDKVYANYRDAGIRARRLQYVLLFLACLSGYIVLAEITETITPFGFIHVSPEHAILFLSPVLGFVYMAIGGLGAYGHRLLEAVTALYDQFGLGRDALKGEGPERLLRPPSVTDVSFFLSEGGRRGYKTAEYTFLLMNTLRIVFLYILPLTMLVVLTVPQVVNGENSYLAITLKLAVYLLLPGIGIAAVTQEYHGAYYSFLEKAVKRTFSAEVSGRKLDLLIWFFGVLIISIGAIDFYLFALFCYLPIIPSVDTGMQWLVLIKNVSLAVLSVSYLTVGIGLGYGYLLKRQQKSQEAAPAQS